MTKTRSLFLIFATSLAGATPCLAASASIDAQAAMPERILALHNRERGSGWGAAPGVG